MISFILLVELALLALYFYFFEVYFLLTLVFFIYYGTLWMDGHEMTGFRTWHAFKRLGPMVRYAWGDKRMEARRCLYVVTGNVSHMGMVGGFGFDRGNMPNVCYMLPHGVFYVPLLRDVLLWTGAVSNRADLLHLLERNWSVAVPYEGQDLERGTLDVSVFEYACSKCLPVVPVSITGDQERFWVWCPRQWRLTQWCEQHLGWPFPFLVVPRKGGPKLRMEVGVPIDPKIYSNAADMRQAFCSMLNLQVDNGKH